MKLAIQPGQLLRAFPLLLVMGGIFYLSHQPGDTLVLPEILDIDKVLHSIAYGVLAGAALLYLPPENRLHTPWKTALATVVFCLVYGISDEVHQLFIAGREADLLDIVADTFGAAVVSGGWYVRACAHRAEAKEKVPGNTLGSLH